jgi:hypothetical protein
MSDEQEPRDETRPKFTGCRQTVRVMVHDEHPDFGTDSIEVIGERILNEEVMPFSRSLSVSATGLSLVAIGCSTSIPTAGLLVVQNLSRKSTDTLTMTLGSAKIRIRPSVPAVLELDSVEGWLLAAEVGSSIPCKVTLRSR